MSKYYKAEDAIKAVTSLFRVSALFSGMNDDEKEWREKAEKVFANIPTIEASKDAISREWVLNAFGLSEKTRKYGGDHSGYDTMMLYEIQDYIEDAPPVIPQAKEGEWIADDDGDKNALIAENMHL